MEIDPVILELRAELSRYNNQLRATTTIVDRSLQQQERRVISLERQFERSSGAISSKLRLLAGTFAGAFSAREIGGLIDGFTRLQNSLRVAGLEGEALASVQERLRQIGATYGVEIEALGSVFSRATLAQKELGASTEEIIRLNEIIAAGLKVTGTSSQQASGALLQLGQALGSDIVRGEEFNSILEGALPIAQAAARGIERFGGSVAKLRTEIVNGNVTSKEFFEGILRGGVDTIAQAERATLTLGGAFTVLRNELTLYVGEASKSNGATAALSSAIQTLAANLDTVANSTAVIGAVLAGRFLAGNNAIKGLTAGTVGYIRTLNEERTMIAATTQASVSGAQAEVAAIQATIAARREDRAQLAANLAIIEAQRASAIQAQAAMAENARLGFGTAVGYGRNDAARANQDLKAQITTKRALAAADRDLAIAERQLAVAQGRSIVATDLATAAAARNTVAARTAAVASKAWAASLAFFGGPVGLAITALAIAIGYAATQTDAATASVEEFEAAADAAGAQADAMEDSLRKAGIQVNDVGDKSLSAASGVDELSASFREATRRAGELAQKTGQAALALRQTQLAEIDATRTAIKNPPKQGGVIGLALAAVGGGALSPDDKARLAALDQQEANVRRQIRAMTANPKFGTPEFSETPAATATVKKDKEKEKKTREKAAQRMASQAEFDEELRRLAAEELQDRLALTSDIEKRAELQEGILSLERQSRVAAIQNDEALTDERKRQLIALTNLRYGLDEQGNIVTNSNKAALVGKELIDRENDLRDAALRDEIRTAEASADLLTNREERLAAEKRILALIEQEERNALERAIADGQVLDAARARANLAQQQSARQTGTDRQFESPLQRYRREVEEGTSNISDAYEEIAVDGVRTLNSELANTVKNVLGLNGALGNTVAKLIEIALQKGAFDLLGSLFSGGKATASDTAVSSALSIASQFIPGRASGGYAGSLVRVNEGASPGRVEGFMPNGGGQIIPLGRMNAMSPQQAGGGTSTIRLELSGDIDARMKSVAAGVSIEVVRTAAPMIREQAAKDVASMNRPRI